MKTYVAQRVVFLTTIIRGFCPYPYYPANLRIKSELIFYIFSAAIRHLVKCGFEKTEL